MDDDVDAVIGGVDGPRNISMGVLLLLLMRRVAETPGYGDGVLDTLITVCTGTNPVMTCWASRLTFASSY